MYVSYMKYKIIKLKIMTVVMTSYEHLNNNCELIVNCIYKRVIIIINENSLM